MKHKPAWKFNYKHLQTLREFFDLSPEDVGKRIGKPGMTIRNWEKGGSPRVLDILAIANEFEIDPRVFFKKSDTHEPVEVG